MIAIVPHEYGPASNLKYEDFPDPKSGNRVRVFISVRL